MKPRTEENEVTEMWRGLRHAQQERRAARLPGRQTEIAALSPEFAIRKLTDYQFRVNERVDVYPVHRRYHVLDSGRRGTYRNLRSFLREAATSKGEL